ncbi:hypothetical protein DAEQUDRAFT_726518 [Daedalea quercina L-15889]|uniref:N-acetyltransferase domain-containing protein n=1 Tax=Daedalea quercina L-15889 TaxID=1314783 RepID=A0A165QJD4_9APHY|nr:hypothetical protein DAEQUDRAFT_726518 [Daedalea quercina L-15889]
MATEIDHIEFKQISPDETVTLRHTVLWPNHPVSHVLLPEDNIGFHYGAFIPRREAPVAVISLFKEPLPPTLSQDGAGCQPGSSSNATARFRKFACEPSQQSRGIGTKLLKHVFGTAARELGCDTIWCDARLATAEWYERRGMTRFGGVFYKEDIPYIRMKASLKPWIDEAYSPYTALEV